LTGLVVMVPLCISTLYLATIGLSFVQGNAVTIEASDSSPHLVRRESMMEVRSSGKLAPQDRAKSEGCGQNCCNEVYYDGTPNSNTCTGAGGQGNLPTDGSRLTSTSKCKDAAERRKFTKPEGTGDIAQNGKDNYEHPEGCFQHPCDEDPTKDCYFYNDVATSPPAPIVGTPICSRPRYVDGTIDATTKDSTCPYGYLLIDDHDECQDMLTCKSYPSGVVFKIQDHIHADELQYDDYPVGCFRDTPSSSDPGAPEGRVYFNLPPSTRAAKTGLPKNPIGTPVCYLPQT